jgi:hypothetical protein
MNLLTANLEVSERDFACTPSPLAAGAYLADLIEAVEADEITDDRFFGGLCEIRDYLLKGGK